MSIAKETIEHIREKLDIVSVVSEYLPNLKKVGKNFTALCPFHSEKSPSFYVSPQKNMFYCFGCKSGGDIFKFVMQIENIPYPEAIKKLAKKLGIDVKETDAEVSGERKVLLDILNHASVFYHKYLVESKDGKIAREYLKTRGVNKDSIEKFVIGYAPESNKLFESAKKKYDPNLIIKSGLVGVSEKNRTLYDNLRGRVVFPVFNLQGDVIAFGGRALDSRKEPVYLNTPDTVMYNKSKSLYGLYQARHSLNKSGEAIILEGYFDVLMLHQNGIENAVAPLGTALTQEHLRQLKRFVETLVLVFDSDRAGQQAAIRSGDLCFDSDMNSRIVSLPEEVDPDEFVLKHGKDKFMELVDSGVNPVEFKTMMSLSQHDINKPEEKSKVVRNVLETIIKIRNPIIKHEMIKFLSSRTNIREEIIVSEMRRAYGFKKIDADESPLDNMSVKLRSIEEEIIWLCLQEPKLCEKVSVNLFSDERCIHSFPVIKQLIKGGELVSIIDNLDKDIADWLIQLSFEQRKCTSFEEIFEKLMRDLKLRRQEEKRKKLELEIIPMLEGRLERNPEKIREFEELKKLLKGTAVN